jgi:fructose-1-phosphate kinase PfkB-like protein
MLPRASGAAEAEKVEPIHKVRTWAERYDPGGGSINAAHVIQELGGAAFAIYLSGGTTEPLLDRLVHARGIEGRSIPIADHTRISHTVHERSSNLEFRFVPEGPAVAPQEWQACPAVLEGLDCEYLLASGSLPRGVPTDFYVAVARLAARKGAKSKSAVGAGDSFLAAMTLGLAQGRSSEDAFVLAVAAGTAAVLTMGTELCRREDVERIYEEIKRGAATSGDGAPNDA